MKLKIYTEPIMIRLNKETMLKLRDKCQKIQMNESVYGRKAIELCLKKNLINSR